MAESCSDLIISSQIESHREPCAVRVRGSLRVFFKMTIIIIAVANESPQVFKSFCRRPTLCPALRPACLRLAQEVKARLSGGLSPINKALRRHRRRFILTEQPDMKTHTCVCLLTKVKDQIRSDRSVSADAETLNGMWEGLQPQQALESQSKLATVTSYYRYCR